MHTNRALPHLESSRRSFCVNLKRLAALPAERASSRPWTRFATFRFQIVGCRSTSARSQCQNDRIPEGLGIRSRFTHEPCNLVYRVQHRLDRGYLPRSETLEQRRSAQRRSSFYFVRELPVVDVIKEIETDFGLPVGANITSQLYVALKAIGMREKITGYGRLMRGLQ